jgi:hypothetical protein
MGVRGPKVASSSTYSIHFAVVVAGKELKPGSDFGLQLDHIEVVHAAHRIMSLTAYSRS